MKNNITFLYKIQASLTILAYKVKNMHWNLYGESFFEVHEELDKLAEDLTELNDQVAEKIVMFEQIAIGSYAEAMEKTFINEAVGKQWSISEVSEVLSYDLNKILDFISKLDKIDFRTQPLIDEVVLKVDKWAWQFKKLTK